MDLNLFDNYSVRALRPQNTESIKLDIRNIGGKFQDNNDFIIHKNLKKLKIKPN